MKLHMGSKREGPLTCDGPDDICCGRDGEGVLEVGDARYSCVECDFDICESCVEAETKEPLTPEQEKAAARQRLREKLGRGSGARKAHDDEAKRQAAKRAAVEAAVADAKAAAVAAKAKAVAPVRTEPPPSPQSPGDADGPEAQAAKKKEAAAGGGGGRRSCCRDRRVCRASGAIGRVSARGGHQALLVQPLHASCDETQPEHSTRTAPR